MQLNSNPIINILGIESSCDDTAAAVVQNGLLLSSVIANQNVHKQYGGVVPELASRAHQQNIVPVVHQAIQEAGIKKEDIHAVAFTRGPGLMGSLLVGTSFAKGFALAADIPLIDVNHLQGHVLSLFLTRPEQTPRVPPFPFICLLVSGGHSQLIVVRDHFDMQIVGQTIDDAAGEAFDKCGKVMGLPYPAGPVIDRLAKDGNAMAFDFSKPRIEGYNYSFSGLKTSFLYSLRDLMTNDPQIVENRRNDFCASLQRVIVEILCEKLQKLAHDTGIQHIALSGGVSANSALRQAADVMCKKNGWHLYIPELRDTTDNAAMIAITGYYKYLKGEFASHDLEALPNFR